MQTYDLTGDPRSEPRAGLSARPDAAELFGATLSRGMRSFPTHERAALASALDDGLMPDEVARILAGRRVAEAFPIRWGESPEAYASRAVSEMFVAYLQ
jgi:hypothetical protein